MKFAVGLTLALTAVVAAQAAPGRLDTSKRASRVSTEHKAALPEKAPLERNEVLLDKRFSTEAVERKDALVGERRSAISVDETKPKQLFSTPERKNYKVIEREESVLSGKQSRFSTKEDAYRSQVATRFQDKISDAQPFSDKAKPAISKRTSFDRINRFVFRKNGDQRITVNAAGSEQTTRDISGSASTAPGSSGATSGKASATAAPLP